MLDKNESLANRGGKVIPSRDELSRIATHGGSIVKNAMLEDLNKNVKNTLGLPATNDVVDTQITLNQVVPLDQNQLLKRQKQTP